MDEETFNHTTKMTRTQNILNRMVKSMRLKQFRSPMEAYDQAVQDYDHEQGMTKPKTMQ